MKLYFAPGACSLASHIALHEAGVPFTTERVDLESKTTATGVAFESIASKGYVPVLVLDDGEILTENLAVLDYLAGQAPHLGFDGPRDRTRLLEALAYISTELHKSFRPFFTGGNDVDQSKAGKYVTRRMQYLADNIRGDYLFGNRPGVADFYLFVTMLWSDKFRVSIPAPLPALRDRLKARPSVQAALQSEGLI